MEILTLFRQ